MMSMAYMRKVLHFCNAARRRDPLLRLLPRAGADVLRGSERWGLVRCDDALEARLCVAEIGVDWGRLG
jgi:hypothetical protein